MKEVKSVQLSNIFLKKETNNKHRQKIFYNMKKNIFKDFLTLEHYCKLQSAIILFNVFTSCPRIGIWYGRII